MPESFEGDLAGSELWGADLSGATFRDVDLTGARISHAVVDDVEVDALVDRLVVNGVDVTAYVNERDPWYPLRTVLRASTPAELREAWARLGEAWAATIARARALPDGAVHESVGGEWSFSETLRHLVFAMDKWFTAPVLGGRFDPLGLPNTGSVDFPWPGLDLASPPEVEVDLDGVLAARSDRADRLRDFLATGTATDDDLDRTVDVLENGPHTVRQCVRVVIEEEFWHHRYAVRDLDRLTRGGGR